MEEPIGKQALITGITGQDGSYLAGFLLERAPGHRPVMPVVVLASLLLALAAVFYLGVLPGQMLKISVESVASIR